MAAESATVAPVPVTAETAHGRPYVYVFLVLAVVTMVEVYISTVAGLMYTDRVMVLVTLATVKASLVVAYYMHLKYEPRWLMFIPFGGLALVFVLVAALITSAGHFPVP